MSPSNISLVKQIKSCWELLRDIFKGYFFLSVPLSHAVSSDLAYNPKILEDYTASYPVWRS